MPTPMHPVHARARTKRFAGSPSARTLAALVCLVAGLGLAATGCNKDTATHDELEALKVAHAETVARLEKLEKARAAAPMPTPQAPRGPEAGKVYGVAVGKSPVRGPADAWVTIVEVSDFQCPFCARAATTLKQVEEAYKAEVRLVFKHNPLSFHPRAMPAAVATACAHAQGKFWPMADALFADQSKLADKDLEASARAAGVNLAQYTKCVAAQAPKASIEADQAEAAKFGARGTPAFFINGRFLSGAQPFASFKVLIDEELQRAKDSKLPQASYYAEQVEKKGAQAM